MRRHRKTQLLLFALLENCTITKTCDLQFSVLGLTAPRRHLGKCGLHARTLMALHPKVALELKRVCKATQCRDKMPPHVCVAATAPLLELSGA